MSSRFKFSSFSENKRSSLNSSNSNYSSSPAPRPKSLHPTTSTTDASASTTTNPLSSLPFRYALASDGCTSSPLNSMQVKSKVGTTSTGNMSSLTIDPQNHSSSSLSGRYYTNGSTTPENPERLNSEESVSKKNESISSQSDIDLGNGSSCFLNTNSPKSIDRKNILFFLNDVDERRRKFYFDEECDSFYDDRVNNSDKNSKTNLNFEVNDGQRENATSNSHSLLSAEFNLDSELSNTMSPLRLDDECSALKRYGIRRHHSAPQSDAKWLQTKRKAIVVQMYDTEKSYVEALKILVTKYYLPLKEKDIVERNLINDIFYKIPEIHVHHELLLSSLKSKFDIWDTRQTIGDLLLNIFAKQSVIETYISFVNNYRTSQEAIRICKEQSSLFSKFVEQQAKEHRGKLSLKDLIIQPVQRIPRYELLVKDFLKCTPINHPDYQYLMKAQKELHNLAEKIDQVHKEVSESYGADTHTVLQIIQDLIENLDDLVTAYRYYIRHDMITVISSSGSKKDRCIFLFSDLVILTSCKRRSGNLNKKTSSIILNSPIGKQYLENVKHKLIMKFQLEDIDITSTNMFKKITIEKDCLEEDLSTISKINELSKTISFPHQNLDQSIREITNGLIRQLNETIQNTNALSSSINSVQVTNNNASSTTLAVNSTTTTPELSDPKQNQIVLTINTTERVEIMTFVFGILEQRNNWEKCFIDAKKTFCNFYSRKPATFLSAIALPTNRSGIHLTCASPRLQINDFSKDQMQNDVWICSTDGQMSQVCIMNTSPELAVNSINTICNSRINSMYCVPPYQVKRNSGYNKKKKDIHKSEENLSESQLIMDDGLTSNCNSSIFGPNANMYSLRSRFLIEKLSEHLGANLEPESLIDYDSSEDDEGDSQSGNEKGQQTSQGSPSTGSNSIKNSIPSLTTNNFQDVKNSTMWIGNEDGSLHIFQFGDSTVRAVARKNRITKQFPSSIQSLIYMDNKVFVSLKNGSLAIFKRVYSVWNYDSYTLKTITSSSFNCMLAVAGKLWCSYGNTIMVLNPSSLLLEHQITVERERHIHIASGGTSAWAVWVASVHSLDLKLYHASKYIILSEVNIKQSVIQKLTGFDELLKINKLSCLRITCLYVCKDTLWIGTSAGIIVNIKIPHINNTTNKLNTTLNVNALNYGHVGPVRFISSVEIPKIHPTPANNSPQMSNEFFLNETTNSLYKTVVISGGEGYEEYKISNNLNTPTTLPNNNTAYTTSISSNQQNHISDVNQPPGLVSNNSFNQANLPNLGSKISTNQPSLDENYLGTDDIANYVLTWEI